MLPHLSLAVRFVVAAVLVVSTSACIDDPLPDRPSPVMTTVSLAGSVVDPAQAPLEGTQVQVVSGGLLHAAVTNAEGLYSMADVTVPSGPLTVRASKPGFIAGTQTRQATITGALLVVDFTLVPNGGVLPFNLAGEHTLTLTAAATCDMLPAAARSRTYQASARSTGNPTSFELGLSGASFFPRHNIMLANVTTPGLLAATDPGNGLMVIEMIGDGSDVSFYGEAAITAWSNDVSAPFAGTIGYCPSAATSGNGLFRVCNAQSVHCTSASHHIRLMRR